jgi:predicted nucleic acid-binding Zn ribbon protein
MQKENCIICDKEISEEHQGLITCSKECSKLYERISQRVYNYLFNEKRCPICRHLLELDSKKNKSIICSEECSKLYDKLVNRLIKKEENANTELVKTE